MEKLREDGKLSMTEMIRIAENREATPEILAQLRTMAEKTSAPDAGIGCRFAVAVLHWLGDEGYQDQAIETTEMWKILEMFVKKDYVKHISIPSGRYEGKTTNWAEWLNDDD